MGALILAVIWICGLGLMEIGDYIWTHYFKQTGRGKSCTKSPAQVCANCMIDK